VKRLLASASLAALALAAPIAAPHPFPFGAPAAMAQAPITIEKLNFKGKTVTVAIPRITVEGSSLPKAEIEALFDPQATASLASRLAQLTAQSVTIPVLEVTDMLPEGTSTTTYRNTVLRNVANGVVAETVIDQVEAKFRAKPGQKDVPGFELTMAKSVMKEMDLQLWARFAFDKAQPGESLKLALAEQTIERTTFKVANVVTVNIGEISGKDFRLRPLQIPLMEMVAKAEQQSAKKGAEADPRASMGMAADMLGAMSFGDMRMKGLSGEAKPPGKPMMRFSMDQMAMAGGGDVPGRFQMQGLKVGNGADTFNMGEVAIEGVSFGAMLGAMQTLAAAPDASAEPDFAAMIPKIETVRMSGLDINVPDAKDPKQRVRAKLGLFETKMGNHVGTIPANVAVTLDRFQMDIPQGTKEKGLEDILAMGYKSLDVSARYEQTWNEAAKTLSIKDVSLRSTGMAAASASAEISNVPREIFTLDKAISSVAALGAAARSMQINITNESLFEKLIAKQASEARRKVEDVRAELAAGVTLMVPMLLGDHPAARPIGAALGRFVAEPKTLKIDIKAQGEGIGATDFLAVANPMEILKKLDITAVANQ